MCLTCGCGQPENRHGRAEHITYSDLTAAASAAGIEPKAALKNAKKTFKLVGKVHPETGEPMSPPYTGG